MLKDVGTCPICGEPLLAAPGQVVRFHRECRKRGREKYGRAQGIKKFTLNETGELTPNVVVE